MRLIEVQRLANGRFLLNVDHIITLSATIGAKRTVVVCIGNISIELLEPIDSVLAKIKGVTGDGEQARAARGQEAPAMGTNQANRLGRAERRT